MSPVKNELGQPVGSSLEGWQPPPPPPRTAMEGRHCRVEPLDVAKHADQLHAAYALDTDGRSWTYLPYGPFQDADALRSWMAESCLGDDPLFFALVEASSGEAVGLASYLRIHPQAGCIEVGHIHFSDRMKKTPAATEAMYLMMERAFDLGYRRYEWKCDHLNEPSRTAAVRLGFTFEGVFRQATVYKGRNRDTAWYSIIDSEWPDLRDAYRAWLSPENFDDEGRQRSSLSERTARLS